LVLDVVDGKKTLIGHCARANPQWKHFADGQLLAAIFNGPHAYISPAWYQPRPDNVPTWNYAAVHVQGTATIHKEPSLVYDVLQKSVAQFERQYQTGWQLPQKPNQDLEAMLNAIVGFTIEIKSIQSKFKLSQNVEVEDRATVIQQLPEFGDVGAAVADYMKRVVLP
jgi:transcriptional regulator